LKLTEASLSNRVAVAVAVILVAIFGLISLAKLPVQLAPNVERPVISVSTAWRGAAPAEVESEILEPQEKVFRGLPGVTRMEGTASRGQGSISLEFAGDMDMQRALLEVINRLNQVPRYPVDATEPTVRVGGGRFGGTVIAWFALRTQPGNPRPIAAYQDFINENILPRLEQIPGVSSANAFGGRPHEIRIRFDPVKAAVLGIDLSSLRFDADFRNTSAGNKDIGKRKYTLRYSGEYGLEELGNKVLAWREGQPVYLRDIATVEKVMQDPTGVINQNGGPSIAMNVIPEAGVNVLDVMQRLKKTIAELEQGALREAGLRITQVYDDSVYTRASIRMVRNNLILGMLLAVGVLWFFLRRTVPALIVALAIPISLLAAFIVLHALGRTLNIISLAGLAFATGMVLDAAIVVLENIVRHREKGESPEQAARIGTQQVWAALLASTATTIAIFLPVVFLKDEAGQLFTDLAVTISASVAVSLLVAISVLPAASVRWMKAESLEDQHLGFWKRVTAWIDRLTATRRQQLAWVIGLIVVPLLLAWWIRPPADYLPAGKRNMSFGFLMPAPGLSVKASQEELADVVAQRIKPYLDGSKRPKVRNYFLGVFNGGAFFGVRAEKASEVDELLRIVNSDILANLPDTFGFARRAPVFRGVGGSRQISVDLQGGDIDQLLAAARMGFGRIQQLIPGAQVRPSPGLELGEPELRLTPDDRALAEVGWNRQQLADIIRALGSGLFVGDYFDGNRKMNVILRHDDWRYPEDMLATPLYAPAGQVVHLADVVDWQRTAGPSQIRRVDRQRTVSLNVTPPDDFPLEKAIAVLRQQLNPELKKIVPADGRISYRGTAKALDTALSSLTGSFLLAVIILYLLISAMFQSFRDAALVITTLPMAAIGGLVGLKLLDISVGQSMDLLTMIGFVILLGLVVNNAILLVYRTRQAQAEGQSRAEAVSTAVRLRLRPILMSTLTSVFGMLPLLLVPGSGTELYRGLAAVIVGGMLVSTVFTLLLLPSLLKLFGREQNLHTSRLS